jgi:hypothetical protein
MSTCECGKVRYLSRREARREARGGFRGARIGKVRVSAAAVASGT